MRIMLLYGRDGLPLNLPDDWDVTIITKKPMPVIARPDEAVTRILKPQPGAAHCLRRLTASSGLAY